MSDAGQDAAGSRPMLSRILLGVAILLLVVGAATTRVVISGEAEVAAGTEALEQGDAREAVVRSRRAASWYAPGAPHVAVAYQRLMALALAAEEHRDDQLALLAWRGVRKAAIETRWVVTPHADDLEHANREIARLMARKPRVAEPDARIASEQLQKLYRHERTRLGWVLALLASFVIAAAGVSLWARQVAAAAGQVQWAKAKGGALLTLLGIGLWLLAVWRA